MSNQSEQSVVRIYNSSEQAIALCARPPGGDFFLHEQSIYVQPGHDVGLPRAYLNMDQVNNLCARGLLQILSDTGN